MTTQNSSDKKTEPWIEPASTFEYSSARAWRLAGVIYANRRVIVLSTILISVISIVVSLLLPKWYQGTAKVLLPESSGGGLVSSMLDDLGPAAASLLGGGGGDYIRYRAILNSSTVLESVIDRFELVAHYDLEDAPLEDVIETLRENVSFEVDNEFQFMAVQVLDRDPQQAADMANYFVTELNRRNAQLLSQDAAQYKDFLKISLDETESALASARADLQAYQEANGIIDLPVQAEAMFTNMAEIRASVFVTQIEADVLERQYGSENQRVRAAMATAKAANDRYLDFLDGNDRLLPVSQDSLPAIATEYARLSQEVLIQAKILEFVRPLYEQARLDEQREKTAVQILDPATKPFYKAKPQRSIIVIMSTFSGFILSIIAVLVIEGFQQHRRRILDRLAQFDRQ